MSKLKTYNHPLGVQIKIFYLDNPESTVNIDNLNSQINDIYNNTKKFDGNLFTGLTIEIYDYRLTDIPKNTYVCINQVNTLKTMGIGNYAGLTTGQLRLIQLNNIALQSKSDMAECLSHEWGHYKAYIMGWNNTDTDFRKYWDIIRGKHATPNTPVVELIAEDLREDEGAIGAIGIERTDKYNYIQADKIQGLKDMYAIWKPGQEFISNFKNNFKINFIIKISEPIFSYDNSDFNYIEVNFMVINYVFPFLNQVYKINRKGIFKNNNLLKSFI